MSYWSRIIEGVVSVVCAALLVAGACSKNSPLSLVPYKPVITFAGIVSGDSLYLPGNRQFPNSCKFYADTVQMHFYSADYAQDTITTGDQLRIDVFSADSQYITNRHARLHFTRYDYNQNTTTYDITPADTLSLYDYNTLSMKVAQFDWQSGGTVDLTDITATAVPVGPYGVGDLSIARGVIAGSIH
ncbi:MAG: hypothetical protein WBM07_05895 [Chitinivibrionales bacterium]